MADEERIKLLEQEVRGTKEELQQILMDIRGFIMGAQNPLRRFERKKTTRQEVQEGGKDSDGKRPETGK